LVVIWLAHASGGYWRALDAQGSEIARAAVLVLANGVGIRALPQAASLPVRPARGQVSHLPASPAARRCGVPAGLREPGGGWRALRRRHLHRRRPGAASCASPNTGKHDKLDFILPGYAQPFDPPPWTAGRLRPASPDRLPMVGAIPAVAVAERTPLADIPRQPGLYAASGFGARGLVWASLAASCWPA
jgi:tRNA 5-methylaminomethyl-2-thiouridine biosynthesis bifunctional protein